MTRKQKFHIPRYEHATRPEQTPKKGWFKRLLERLAKEHEKSGGQLCVS